MGRPGQHDVIAGEGFAIGVHRIVGDLVVQDQRLATDHRHRPEVPIGEHLPVGSMKAEAGEYARERLRSG